MEYMLAWEGVKKFWYKLYIQDWIVGFGVLIGN